MGKNEIREPIQKRSIEKKENIIKAGFELICKDGYYNTNTAKIAQKANVSTGIVYQYFADKHDIFIAGLEKYADTIFYPLKNIPLKNFNKKDFPIFLKNFIKEYIKNHKLSQSIHEEIIAMIHSDKEIAYYYYKREMDMTCKIASFLQENNFECDNINERVHIMIGIIDNLCHEIVYHKHKEIDYNIMTEFAINSIISLFK